MMRFAFTLAVAVLFAPSAMAQEKVDNGEYKAWASQKVGTVVKYKMDMSMGGMQVAGDISRKLVEVTAEKAVIEETMKMTVMGQQSTQTTKREIAAKVNKGEEWSGEAGAKVSKTGEGDEEIEVAGKKMKCHWIEMDVEGKEGKLHTKAWTSSDLVGGLAKTTMTAEMQGTKVTTTMTFVESKTE